MSKLSPKDFNSITDWIKQYVGMIKPEPLPKLSAPVYELVSNDTTQL